MNRIRLKRANSIRWSELNPILAAGEPGYETDTGRMKIGDEVTPWNQLDYFNEHDPGQAVTTEQLQEHVDSETPHPTYDDGSSFILRYQNAKV